MNVTINAPKLGTAAHDLALLAIGFTFAMFAPGLYFLGCLAAAMAGMLVGFVLGAGLVWSDERNRMAAAKAAHASQDEI